MGLYKIVFYTGERGFLFTPTSERQLTAPLKKSRTRPWPHEPVMPVLTMGP